MALRKEWTAELSGSGWSGGPRQEGKPYDVTGTIVDPVTQEGRRVRIEMTRSEVKGLVKAFQASLSRTDENGEYRLGRTGLAPGAHRDATGSLRDAEL